jgi:hypothetical protein
MVYIKEIVGKKGNTFRVDWQDPDGRERVRNFKKKMPANEWKRKVEYAPDNKTYGELIAAAAVEEAATITLAVVAEDYLLACTREKGYKIKAMVLHSLLKTETLNGTRADAEITYTDLVHFKTERLNTPTRGGRPRALAAWNNELVTMSALFKYAKQPN